MTDRCSFEEGRGSLRREHSEQRASVTLMRAVRGRGTLLLLLVVSGSGNAGNGDGIVNDGPLVGGGADKVKATGERCRGRVMTTQRIVNAFMSRVAL